MRYVQQDLDGKNLGQFCREPVWTVPAGKKRVSNAIRASSTPTRCEHRAEAGAHFCREHKSTDLAKIHDKLVLGHQEVKRKRLQSLKKTSSTSARPASTRSVAAVRAGGGFVPPTPRNLANILETPTAKSAADGASLTMPAKPSSSQARPQARPDASWTLPRDNAPATHRRVGFVRLCVRECARYAHSDAREYM